MKRILYLTFAALLLMAVSCKKDENHKNSFKFDGVDAIPEVSISKSEMEQGDYAILFAFSTHDTQKTLWLTCSSSLDGKTIDLTKGIASEAGSWQISCYGEGGGSLFVTNGGGMLSNGWFQSGTLQVKKGEKGDGTVDFSIILKKGKTKGTIDNNDHTVEINFNGPVRLVAGFE
jgi:hypothetical protein